MLTVVACGKTAVKNIESLNISGTRKIKKIAVLRDSLIEINGGYNKYINIGDSVEKIIQSKGRMELAFGAEDAIRRKLSYNFMDTEIAIVAAEAGDERDIILVENVCEVLSQMGVLNLCVITQSADNDLIQRIIFKSSIEEIQRKCSSLFNMDWKNYNENVIELCNNLHDLIHFNGVFNLNIGDFYKIFNSGKISNLAYATANGDNRGKKVVEKILNQPEIGEKLMKSENILINITGNRSLALHEVKSITEEIYDKVNENSSIIFGTLINDSYVEDIKISMIMN